MSLPSRTDRHIDHHLTDFSIGYIQDAGLFVARRMADITPVMHKSNRYPVYDKADTYRDEMQKRAWGTESESMNQRISNEPYYADDYALHKDVSDPERDDADPVFDDLNTEATELLTQKALIKEDRVASTNLFTTGIWNTDQTGVAAGPVANQFLQFDAVGGDPLLVMENSLDFVQTQTGFRPNGIVMGSDVWTVVKNNSDVIDRIKHTGLGVATPGIMADLLEIDEFFVTRGVYNTAAEGATVSMSKLFDPKAFLVYYKSGRPGRRIPTACRMFAWTRPSLRGTRSIVSPFVIKNFRNEATSSDRIEIEGSFDIKVTGADLAQFHASAVS